MDKGGLIFRKQEMTQLWINDKFVPVTLLKLVPQEIVRYKTMEKDGYLSVVVGAEKKELKKERGQKIKYAELVEFSINENFMNSYQVGGELNLSLMDGVEEINIKGISKGKGFQGVIKRYGFGGGPETHGSKFHRVPGSVGNRKPRRINKGHPLPGHMGLDNITLKKVKVVDRFEVDNEKIIAVKGSVPGHYNSIVRVVL